MNYEVDFRVVEVEESKSDGTEFDLLVMDDWSCPLIVGSYKHEIFNYFNDDIPQNVKPSWKGFEDPTIRCVSVSDSCLFVHRCEYFMLRIRDEKTGKSYALCRYPQKAARTE